MKNFIKLGQVSIAAEFTITTYVVEDTETNTTEWVASRFHFVTEKKSTVVFSSHEELAAFIGRIQSSHTTANGLVSVDWSSKLLG